MDIRDMETARIGAALKVAGDPAFDILTANAAAALFKTEFNKRVKRFESQYRIQRARDESTDRRVFVLFDPNDYATYAAQIEQDIGNRELAFSFAGNPVVIKRMQSTGRIVQRDAKGDKVLDHHGDPVTEIAWTHRAKIMKGPEFLTTTASVARFLNNDGEGRDVPRSLLAHVEAIAGETLKPISSIATHPVMWRGEMLFGNNVYHAPSGLYLVTGNVDLHRWNDPQAAYECLRDTWLGDFPFASEVDALVAIQVAATLLVVKTDLLHEPGPPITSITAPSPGIGKSFLSSILYMAVTGESLPTIMYPDEPVERQKLIMSCILEGYSCIAFDNMPNGYTLGNSHKELLQATGTDRVGGRILGINGMVRAQTGAMFIINGNGIVPAGDMVSRVLNCHLSPGDGITNTVQRNFKHADLAAWTRENRGKILGALQSILSVKATERQGTRFKAWGRSIASPLMEVSGIDGLYDPWIEAGEEDAKGIASQNALDLIAAIWVVGKNEQDKPDWHTSAELLGKLSVTHSNLLFTVFRKHNPSLQEFLNYLLRHRDAKNGGVRLQTARLNLGRERTGGKRRQVFKVG